METVGELLFEMSGLCWRLDEKTGNMIYGEPGPWYWAEFPVIGIPLMLIGHSLRSLEKLELIPGFRTWSAPGAYARYNIYVEFYYRKNRDGEGFYLKRAELAELWNAIRKERPELYQTARKLYEQLLRRLQ